MAAFLQLWDHTQIEHAQVDTDTPHYSFLVPKKWTYDLPTPYVQLKTNMNCVHVCTAGFQYTATENNGD